MKLLTGNDLRSGLVMWWTGDDWSVHIEDATDVSGNGQVILAAEEKARRINSPYIIDADNISNIPRPVHIKERVRALGPTIRGDLTLKPHDTDLALAGITDRVV